MHSEVKVEPTNSELFKQRAQEFLNNIWDLWLDANNDQRIFLGVLLGFIGIYSLIALKHLYWRVINCQEIRKVQHFTAMRRHMLDREEPK